MKCKICNGKTKIKYEGLYDDRHGYPGKFDLLECTNCGFMQTVPELNKDQISNIYSKYYPRQDINIESVRMAGKNMLSIKEIKKRGLIGTCCLDTKKGEKVLDIGSGIGHSLIKIKALGGEAWGLDPDINAQKVAKKLKLNFHHGFIDDCPFDKKSFDLITASQVLEHIPDPLEFLKIAKRFLKPGGRMMLSFPNTGAWYQKLWSKKWLHWHIPYHLNHFNKKSIETLINQSGLKIVEIKTTTPNLWTILQIKSWLANIKEGERDNMWDGKPAKNKDEIKRSWFQELAVRALPRIEKLLVVNRLIDWLKLGESFVVELRQK